MPAWAVQLLAGKPPAGDDGEHHHEYFLWLFCDLVIPGLPDPWSEEGCKIRQPKEV
jgi:hypothetical protein